MSRGFKLVETRDVDVIEWFEYLLPFFFPRQIAYWRSLNERQQAVIANKEFNRFAISGTNLVRVMMGEDQLDWECIQELKPEES
jgi:hypothetical protein